MADFGGGELVQKAITSDLVVGPLDPVRYVSTVLTLRPVTEISGTGKLDHRVRAK
ncbi:hypothetical protein [Amycolatopsis taiwanensis]|uniref:Uncharacterized protein n=1 Tax=Amycolatopsis taiwanensis TaxID=342230 RepID=A0A9W6VL39_9PSEU|nr:hypothetical protein [Amycolatopsis taiwanensis]GLY71229.1 hypothetical protein Atai01_78480 [Amycolatopsis taiwanensis]